MNQDQAAAARAVTVAHDDHAALQQELLARVAGCFPRRESRTTCGQMLAGLLMELEDKNCWTLAEAVGHPTPDRLQHFLARASWDEQQVMTQLARWAIEHLDDGDTDHTVLIIDETADAKSSTDAAGAARQYSGTLGGVALCQVAVHLAYATPRGHTILDRALYLPEGRAADEEHRELAHIPEQTMFATKPQLAAALLQRAHAAGCAPPSPPGTRSTADANCAPASAPWTWAMCWPSAPAPRLSPTPAAPSPPRTPPGSSPPAPGCGYAPAAAPRAPATTTGRCWPSSPTTPPTDKIPDTPPCWSAATATPAIPPSTAAGARTWCRWPA
ncbi:transposase [Nonomuraea sp. KC401]|nr:hypothetical protein [Nonomuraea sp. K271]TLF71160.1 transposase [Nonomuraea sp. KC401]